MLHRRRQRRCRVPAGWDVSAQRWDVYGDGAYLHRTDADGTEWVDWDALESQQVVLAADYERDVAAAEERGWNAAVRQLAGEGCTWADGDCPNGSTCLCCKNLDALITERAKGDVEGWNAALEAVLEAVDLYHPKCLSPCELCAEWDDLRRAIAALRKDTGREVGG